jgi:hypothetical protein
MRLYRKEKNMLTRNENGKLKLNTLDAEIFFGDLLYKAKNESELEFIKDNLVGIIENIYEEVLDNIS